MKRHCTVLVAVALVVTAACGRDTGNSTETVKETILTAETLSEQTVLSASEYLATAEFDGANVENGERQALLCKACHSLEKGGVNMIGPNLFGFFGNRIGTVEGFDYSKAVMEAEFVWTPRALDAWLVQPGRFLPGNRMTFAGVGNADNRLDLIAYLLTVTDDGQQRDE